MGAPSPPFAGQYETNYAARVRLSPPYLPSFSRRPPAFGIAPKPDLYLYDVVIRLHSVGRLFRFTKHGKFLNMGMLRHAVLSYLHPGFRVRCAASCTASCTASCVASRAASRA